MKLSPLSWVSSLVRGDAPTAKPAVRSPSMYRAQPTGRRGGGHAAERSSPAGEPALSSLAQAWLARLPSRIRPLRTAAAYPRIVNRLALCWSDPELLARVFSELMVDERGGRRGFPPEVAAELLALRDIDVVQSQPAAAPTRAWQLHTVATSDRDSRFDTDALATRF